MPRLGRVFAAAAAIGFCCAAYLYLTLPDVRGLRTTSPSTTAFIELRARQERANGLEPRRIQRWVSYRRISPHLKRAVLVAEDSAFWQHDGVDYDQLKESMEVNLERGEFVRGASTITQQLAKNLYLSPAKNPIRKLRELLIARRLEAELSKQRILELYLNVIEWGEGIYGAEAAARTYFGKAAADLGPQESALLAGAIINPRVLTPAHPTARLRRRQQMIMRRMGAVTPPPVVAEAAAPPADVGSFDESVVPSLPPEELPETAPGQLIAPEEPAPVKPCAVPPCR
jgi:monofunctional biosynthetic peptidoglycan transglycosylase